jgi:phosphate-selective porin
LRFRGRPESNISSYFVDSGDLAADHAREIGFESLVGNGPFFVTSEYVHAWVDATETRNSAFWGTYVTASYVLTGEHRPYDRKVAYARRVMPKGRSGAWEVFARYSHLDIDDRMVDGGVLNKGTLGMTWWATRHWRIGVDYGLSDLDRFGKHGIAQSIHPRLQWVY